MYIYIPCNSKRGKPKKRPDEIILVLIFLQVAWKLSFKEVELIAVQLFERENIPNFSTYYYRLKNLLLLLLIDFLNFLSRRLLGKYYKEIKFLIADETGFKYDELYPLRILRGLEIKKVRGMLKQ